MILDYEELMEIKYNDYRIDAELEELANKMECEDDD